MVGAGREYLSDAGSADLADEQLKERLGADVPDVSSPVAGLKHCWVTGPDVTVPGCCSTVGTTRSWVGSAAWSVPVREEIGWLVMEDWLPADELRAASTDGP